MRTMFLKLIAIAVVLMALLPGPQEAVGAEKIKPTEHEVKAAYLYNFARFVEWPPLSSPGAGKTLEICVVEDEAVTAALAAIAGKVVGQREIRIKPNPPLQSLPGCDLLFIGAGKEGELQQILAAIAVNDRAVLTVGDTEGFARQGVMINFYTEKNRILFEINPPAADRAHLKISSALLRIARIVGEP
jgi:hypothetical protein